MRFLKKISGRVSGLFKALSRYPLAAFFLVAVAITNAIAIGASLDYSIYWLTFLVGAFLAITLQAVRERFFDKSCHHLLLMVVSLFLTLAYFLIVKDLEKINLATGLRTMVGLFALLIAYIWLPSLKTKVTFSDSFLIAFKAFFNALLFSLVLYLGISLILGAIDLLLVRIPMNLYVHNLNIVGIIFAPLYFLSLIPVYPAFKSISENEKELKAHYPKFLDLLISNIIIPLLAIYTVILLVYIVANVSGDFWTDNRLEPMLVSFAIAVITVNLLASGLKNPFVDYFRRIGPKVLVGLVFFQIIASILKSQEVGITHGRYYVIFFGFFAIIAGLILSVKALDKVDKNGLIAALFIGFSLFSITPPLDAFTISYTNQSSRLTNALAKNGMIVNQEIIPNLDVTQADQKLISETVNYLLVMGYQPAYLDEDFSLYEDFYQTFGFYQTLDDLYDDESLYFDLDSQIAIDISNYDSLLNYNAYYEASYEEEDEILIGSFEKSAKTFRLIEDRQAEPSQVLVKDDKGEVLIKLDMIEVFNYFETMEKEDYQKGKPMTPDDATFILENDEARLSLVAQFIGINKNSEEPIYNGDFYVLVEIKE